MTMDVKGTNVLLMMVSGVLALGGMALLLVASFMELKDNWTLNLAMMAIFYRICFFSFVPSVTVGQTRK